MHTYVLFISGINFKIQQFKIIGLYCFGFPTILTNNLENQHIVDDEHGDGW